ncbi:MAG: hypothetical protein GXY44_09760 [Phycisphaerales bacterium]|nr:hypothetical protein [Phycisphaerales bacterium]
MSLSAAALAAPPAQAAMPGSPPLVIAQALPDNPARISPQEKEDDEREVLVIQALDQPTDLSVRDTPIGDAIKQLVEKTGIETVIAQGTFALLPHGAQTRLSSSFQNKPLREGLNALLLPLGLQFTPTSRGLVIEPSAPLRRIARRSAWEEVETLALLRHRPWSDQLFDSLSFQFQDTAGGDLEDHRKTLKRLADAVGVGNAAEVLELACEQYGWTWYPNGDKIVILSKARQIERQLDQRVDLRYDQVSLKDVLLDLAQRANVLLRMDGGVLTTLPQQGNDRFLLNVQNTTIRQVFDLVAGQTGVSYIIEPDGVRLTVGVAMPTSTSVGSDLARAASEAYRLNPIVGQITFQSDDGASYSFFLRENDFPPEINELRKLRMRQSVVELGHSLKAEQPRD